MALAGPSRCSKRSERAVDGIAGSGFQRSWAHRRLPQQLAHYTARGARISAPCALLCTRSRPTAGVPMFGAGLWVAEGAAHKRLLGACIRLHDAPRALSAGLEGAVLLGAPIDGLPACPGTARQCHCRRRRRLPATCRGGASLVHGLHFHLLPEGCRLCWGRATSDTRCAGCSLGRPGLQPSRVRRCRVGGGRRAARGVQGAGREAAWGTISTATAPDSASDRLVAPDPGGCAGSRPAGPAAAFAFSMLRRAPRLDPSVCGAGVHLQSGLAVALTVPVLASPAPRGQAELLQHAVRDGRRWP